MSIEEPQEGGSITTIRSRIVSHEDQNYRRCRCTPAAQIIADPDPQRERGLAACLATPSIDIACVVIHIKSPSYLGQ